MGTGKKLFWIIIFGVAFGLVEAVVVVYLRNLYYPQGFVFPSGKLPPHILRTEIIREAATILMLIAISILASHKRLGRVGLFLILFGIWDIFYYIWLKVFLDWPETLFDWDILFLIPRTWAAPVLAPLLVCFVFIGCGTWLFWRVEKGHVIKLSLVDWIVEILAGVIIISSFFSNDGMSTPQFFPWWLFLIGLLGGVGYFFWRFVKQ